MNKRDRDVEMTKNFCMLEKRLNPIDKVIITITKKPNFQIRENEGGRRKGGEMKTKRREMWNI